MFLPIGRPLQASILTMLFLDSLKPVPLIRTLDHFAGKLIKFETDLFRPISYLKDPPGCRVFPSPWVLCFRTSTLFLLRSATFREASGLELVDVMMRGISVGCRRWSVMITFFVGF
jgi:hypothetical protein